MLKIAHRGASGHRPENTLAAFEKAIELGADMIEFDVRRCASGELVVIHDAGLLRTFNFPDLVRRKKLSELKNLNPDRRLQILTLREAFQFLADRVLMALELKERGTASEVIDSLTATGWAENRVLVCSFLHEELLEARRLFPSIALAPIYLLWPFGWRNFTKKIQAKAIITNHFFTNQNLIRQVHDHGLGIYVWTLNSPQEIAKFKSWGVDGIISNYPDRL